MPTPQPTTLVKVLKKRDYTRGQIHGRYEIFETAHIPLTRGGGWVITLP